MNDFLAHLIGNQTRAKLLRVFVLSESRSLSLADATKRAGVSAQAAAREIKWLEELDLVKQEHLSITIKNNAQRSVSAGKQKIVAWIFNADHKHARALSAFVHEISPMRHDAVMEALKGSGKFATVILSGAFMGDPSRPADLILAADVFNERRLDQAIRDLEPAFGREIRYAAFSTPEFRYRLTIQDRLIRDTLDFPHLVLLDRTRLL